MYLNRTIGFVSRHNETLFTNRDDGFRIEFDSESFVRTCTTRFVHERFINVVLLKVGRYRF